MEKDASLLVEETELGGRRPKGAGRYVLFGLGVAWSLFQLWATELGTLDPMRLRAVHLAFALALAFLAYPGRRGPRERIPLLDWGLALLGVAGALYVVWDYYGITQLRGGIPSQRDVFMGTLTLGVLFLAAWRVVGPALPIIASVFVLYALTGPKGLLPFTLPSWLQLHAGSQWGQLMGQLYTTAEGIWGVPLGVSATFVFLFVLFGALLERAGAGHFFIQVAYALLGHFRGGARQGGGGGQRPHGGGFGQFRFQRGHHGHLHHPLDEAGGVSAGESRGSGGGLLLQRAAHASGHGGCGLHHGGVPGHPL